MCIGENVWKSLNTRTYNPECEGCIYYRAIWEKQLDWTCDYYVITGKRRGCPTGDQCTKREEGEPTPKRRKKKAV